MNDFDFFFTPPAATGNNGEDDDWGEFVESLSPKPNGILADRNGSNGIESEKNSQTKWASSRGPVPLSVFGEEEDEDAEPNSDVSPFNFSFTGSVNRVGNTNPILGINGLIATLYPENKPNELNSNSIGNGTAGVYVNSHSRRNFEDSETVNWNPLKLDTERTSNVLNSSTIRVDLDPNSSDLRIDDDDDGEDDEDGWEFKTSESIFQTANGHKEEEENTKTGSVVVENTTSLSSHANGTSPSFDAGKVGSLKLDEDPWDNGGWEFKVAEPKNDLINKESNGWGFDFGFEPVSKMEKAHSFQSNFERETQKKKIGSISLPSNGNVDSGGASWAFNLPSSETEEKEVQVEKPKGVLPLSFFEDEESGTSDTLVHEDNLDLASDFPVRDKTKASSPIVSINDLISSLYSQMEEEKNAVNISEGESVSVKDATSFNLVNGENDSWEFQGSGKTITEGDDDFDTNWEFQGPSVASDVTEGVNEFDNDSWEFQGPTQPVKDSTLRNGGYGSCENIHSPVKKEVDFHGGPSLVSDVTEEVNEFEDDSWEFQDPTQPISSPVKKEVEIQSSVPNGFAELQEKSVIMIEPHDYRDVFHKLKTELYYTALDHLETLKDARDGAAEFVEKDLEDRNWDSEIEELQNWLSNDVLRSEVNLENFQPKSSASGITELYKVLQEPKFQALDSEDHLSERLLLAKRDWKSTIELLKYASLTLKTLNLGSHEEQSEYVSTWYVIASACAQELRHAASIWKQVVENDVQEKVLSKPQGKSYVLAVGEIYRVVKVLKASIKLYKPWILLHPTLSNVSAVLDDCVILWLSSGLKDHSDDQLLESIKYLEQVDAFMIHTCISAGMSPACYISGLNTEIVPGTKMVEWNGEHYLLPLVNLWANLVSRNPPTLRGYDFHPVS